MAISTPGFNGRRFNPPTKKEPVKNIPTPVNRRPSRKPRPKDNVITTPGFLDSPAPGNTVSPIVDDVPVQPVPDIPTPVQQQPTQPVVSTPVKPATPDLIIFDNESVPIDVMSDLIFENIGGQELISIARNDIVNGQSVVYRPIKNLSSLALRYNPQNIIALQNTSNKFFENFPIKLENHIPDKGTGPANETVYIDPTNNNLIINVVGLAEDERVEVQILTNGSILNDTIYIEEES
jgi:hypothetical protein